MTTIFFLRVLLISTLLIILCQDFKERAVWWFLFPLFAAIAGYLHFTESLSCLFLPNIMFNLLTVGGIFFLAFLYVCYKMKVSFFKDAIGAGDILFFLGLAVAFPSEAFVVILVFSMIFSLGLHSILSLKKKNSTVPLAGYSSFFVLCIYLCSWLGIYENLYSIG